MNPVNPNSCGELEAASPGPLWLRAGRRGLQPATRADQVALRAALALDPGPWRHAECLWPLPIEGAALFDASGYQADVLHIDQQIRGVAWRTQACVDVTSLLQAPWGELPAALQAYITPDPAGDMLLGLGRSLLVAEPFSCASACEEHGALLRSARMGLAQQAGHRGWIAAVPLPGLRKPSKATYSPRAYVQQVEAGSLQDPALTPALRAGAHVLGVHSGGQTPPMPWEAREQVRAEESAPAATPFALLMWLNPSRR